MDMRKLEQKERNAEIARLYLTTEMSLKELAVKFKISQQRIHQIVKREQVKLAGGEKL